MWGWWLLPRAAVVGVFADTRHACDSDLAPLLLFVSLSSAVAPRYNVKVDIDNHLRYSDEEYKQHLTVGQC